MYSRCVTFIISLDILLLAVRVYPCPCSLMTLLCESQAKQNRRGERLSPWKILRHIFTPGISIFPFECCSINVMLHCSIAFSISLIICGVILYICMHFIIHECGTLSNAFFTVYPVCGQLGPSRVVVFEHGLLFCSILS